jgi:predicted dehydrogenase
MDRKIKTAIVGFGLSGRVFHAPFLHDHPGFDLVYVVERYGQSSKEIYPEVQVVRHYEELLEKNDLDLVALAVPNTEHYLMAKEFLEAGKHVVVEKPFTPTAAEADELILISQKTGRKIFVYHNRRFDGDFKTVQQLVYHGYLGELLHFEAHFDRFAPGPRRSAWRDAPLPAGGVFFDLGSHLIDQALVLFGMPKSVFADIRKLRPEGKVDDCFEVKLRYEILTVTLKASVFVKEPGPRYILHGRKGSFVKYGIDPQEELLKQGFTPGGEGWGEENPENWGVLHTEMNGQQFRGQLQTEPGNYMEFYDNVHEVLKNGAEMAIRPEEARNVIRIIELAFRSADTGTIVPVAG